MLGHILFWTTAIIYSISLLINYWHFAVNDGQDDSMIDELQEGFANRFALHSIFVLPWIPGVNTLLALTFLTIFPSQSKG